MDESDLLVEFVEEAREHLGDIEIQLLQIEAMGEAVDDQLVNTVFRAIHSVKGAAGFLGLQQINEVSHRLEDVLGRVRDKKLVPDPYNVDVMLKAADRIKGMVESIETSNETDNTELCQKLDEILESQKSGESSAEPSVEAEAPKTKRASKAKANAGETKTGESATKTTRARKSTAANRKTASSGKASSTRKSAAAEKTEKAPTAESTTDVTAKVEQSLDQVEQNLAKTTGPQDKAAPPTKIAKPASDPTIRVGIRVLDRLMNLAGELVLSRNQLIQAMASSGSDGNSDKNLDSIVSGLDQVTTDLQETIMQTRMQPIGNVFNKFPRVIRDLSSSLGKQINLLTEGNEVETDKTIIEAIADPLTHLIRNSCDHGVEMPEVREAAGKPAAGTVSLKAYHQAGKVMIEINDDGAGIDPEKLKAKAIEKGILDEAAAARMNDLDAVNLIFAPGFSTAAAITDVSGRGVGMDVVRTNIEKIGGSVEVRSRLGLGSSVQITLPLTLAIVPSMIIAVGERRYALPQSHIAELVRTDGKEKCIQRASGAEVLRLRGSLLPLIRLRSVLGLPPRKKVDSGVDETETNQELDDDSQLVVVESGRLRFALAVDRVLDSEEIVVKPLGRHLSNLPLLAGSTILGDGRVAMILDSAGIASRIELTNEAESDEDQHVEKSTTVSSKDLQRMVLLSVSEQDRFAVSMDIVSRIERIKTSEIQVVGEHRLLQYRGSTLLLVTLHDTLKVAQVEEPDHVQVVVFKVYGHEVGLVTPFLDDIRDCDLSAGVEKTTEVGVAGIAVIDDKPTRLLDLYGLTEQARPEWFEPTEEIAEAKTARILVCEDSTFFRNFLRTTLENAGHTVSAAEDGQKGWEIMDLHAHDFDLLVTDVEMPNLNGLELTKRLRADGRFADLPIIALTSLSDEQSTQKGKEAGVSEYQVKMNKPELLMAISKLVSQSTRGSSGSVKQQTQRKSPANRNNSAKQEVTV